MARWANGPILCNHTNVSKKVRCHYESVGVLDPFACTKWVNLLLKKYNNK